MTKISSNSDAASRARWEPQGLFALFSPLLLLLIDLTPANIMHGDEAVNLAPSIIIELCNVQCTKFG